MVDPLQQLSDLQTQVNKLQTDFLNHDHDGINSNNTGLTSFASQTVLVGSISTNYSIFYVASFPCFVRFIEEVHTVAGTDAGAVTLQVEKLTGTVAPGSGINLLTTALSLKATANTSQKGAVVLGRDTGLRVGDRLALKSSGVLTTVGVVLVTVSLEYKI